MEASGQGQVNETLSGASSIPGQHSPWHSPVLYLFGGLAAMLGLIAFALLLLACSYWKLSGYLGSRDGDNRDGLQQDLEAGDEEGELPKPPVFEEKVLVIMAGQVKPTFLATPASSRASSFGSTCMCGGREHEQENGKVEMVKQDGDIDHMAESGTASENLPA